jgi:hypothetical protein
MPGDPQLPNYEDVERHLENLSHLISHRHSPTRERQHDDIALAFVMKKPLGQELARLPPVAKAVLGHFRTSCNGRAGKKTDPCCV